MEESDSSGDCVKVERARTCLPAAAVGRDAGFGLRCFNSLSGSDGDLGIRLASARNQGAEGPVLFPRLPRETLDQLENNMTADQRVKFEVDLETKEKAAEEKERSAGSLLNRLISTEFPIRPVRFVW